MDVRVNRGLLLVLLLAGAALFFWQQRQIEKKESDTGLLSTRILSAVFTSRSDLRVRSASGEALARAKGCSLRCWVQNGVETRAPFSVDYFVTLKGLPASAFRWNERDRIMSVDVPDVWLANPNIDWAKAKVKLDGWWISRDAGLAMQKQAAGYLAIAAKNKAAEPEQMARARDDARTAIANFVSAPLRAAGLPDTRVVVRFQGDPKPVGISDEQWDMSRPIEDVLRDHP